MHPWAGRPITRDCYRQVKALTHSRAKERGYVNEHVVIAEAALGKALPVGAEVHHVNGDKTDNRSSNLVICPSKAYHKLLHRRIRIRAAGGDPNLDKICSKCQVAVPLSDFTKHNHRCRKCAQVCNAAYRSAHIGGWKKGL